MHVIDEQKVGAAWKMAYQLVMNEGSAVKDDGVNLLEVLDLFIVVHNVSRDDEILQKDADQKLIDWMVDDNFGGNLPVLNWGYSYGMRFRDFHGVNQVDKIVSRIQNNPECKSATISLMDPTTDFAGHMPCIIGLDFKLRNNKLHVTGYFRSQDIGKKVYADFLAISKIQHEVANKLKSAAGDVKILISSAHIYEQDFGKFGTRASL